MREPRIYGSTSLAQIEADCRAFAKTAGMTIDVHQSNHEGHLIDWVRPARETGYTFTPVLPMDALKMFKGPMVEVHMSNIHARAATDHHSKIAPIAKAVMVG